MNDDTTIRRGSLSDLPAIEPLWISVHRRHVESMPQLAPYVDEVTTWAKRERLYVDLLDSPDTILVLAEVDGTLVGYGTAHVLAADQTWAADTWVTGPRIGEIESLAVLPTHRGRGIGGLLLDRLEKHLEKLEVADVILGVLPGNAPAMRLYERRGFRPTWLYMSRFAERLTSE